MRYAKKDGDNWKLIPRPKWTDAKSGEQLTDSDLIHHGIFRVVAEKPEYNPNTERIKRKPPSFWVFDDNLVYITYEIYPIPVDSVKRIKANQIEQERISRTQYMPWTIPSSGTQVEVKIAEEPPGKPRQTWLSGTCSWGLACVQEGTPDELDTLIAADDSLHSMTASEWVQFGKALKLWVRDNMMTAKQHMANVQALDTAQDVIDYDFSTGWPS